MDKRYQIGSKPPAAWIGAAYWGIKCAFPILKFPADSKPQAGATASRLKDVFPVQPEFGAGVAFLNRQAVQAGPIRKAVGE